MQKKDAASDNIDKTVRYDNDDQECLLRLGFGGFMLILARDRGAGAQGASQDDRPGSGAVQRGALAHSTCCKRVLSVWGATIAFVCVFYLARCCQNLY